MEKSYQCTLHKNQTRQTAWLPQKYAVKGTYVGLKENGIWEEGWLVEQVGSIGLPSKYLAERSQDYKKTRNASDI